MSEVPERCPRCGAAYTQTFGMGHHFECRTRVSQFDGKVSESERCLRRQLEAARAEAERLRTAARDIVRLHDEHIDPGMAGPYAMVSHEEEKRKAIERLKEALQRLNATRVIVEDDGGTP